MRVVVTGAGGFIGTHFTRIVGETPGTQVVAVRRTLSGASGRELSVQADLSNPGWTNCLPPGADAVVHLAQSRSHRSFPEGAEDVHRVNIDATFELLEWARRNGVKRFIYASTGSVYLPQTTILVEESPIAATAFYCATKIAGEALCTAYQCEFDIVITRLFGVYGTGSTEGVFSRLLRKIASGQTIELDGGLGLITTPTHAEDCIHAFQQILDARLAPNAAAVVNLCGDEEISLLDACQILGHALGRSPSILANDKPAVRLTGSNARLKDLVGWVPRWKVRDGLSELARSYR